MKKLSAQVLGTEPAHSKRINVLCSEAMGAINSYSTLDCGPGHQGPIMPWGQGKAGMHNPTKRVEVED